MTAPVFLTPHFTLEEFTASTTASHLGIDNEPPAEIIENLRKTAQLLERVRRLLGGKPLIITSGYRSPALNAAIGGAAGSDHLQGRAADFICPEFGSPLALCRFLEWNMVALEINQLIHEFDSWVHISCAEQPAHTAFTIDAGGTRNGIG